MDDRTLGHRVIIGTPLGVGAVVAPEIGEARIAGSAGFGGLRV